MQITTFNPMILSKNADAVIALFEELTAPFSTENMTLPHYYYTSSKDAGRQDLQAIYACRCR